ncbi:hypothetical protein CEXT_783931 [Caerostris extrusa]|uniref:Uncharacterized protein n=1 Tax=Caerostris extrusa TaxID=172846 RepID=A0AAV4NPT2_CAEEX|nr:hypothetical protein CEXT_783931 [Caerostris extrusa]
MGADVHISENGRMPLHEASRMCKEMLLKYGAYLLYQQHPGSKMSPYLPLKGMGTFWNFMTDNKLMNVTAIN